MSFYLSSVLSLLFPLRALWHLSYLFFSLCWEVLPNLFLSSFWPFRCLVKQSEGTLAKANFLSVQKDYSSAAESNNPSSAFIHTRSHTSYFLRCLTSPVSVLNKYREHRLTLPRITCGSHTAQLLSSVSWHSWWMGCIQPTTAMYGSDIIQYSNLNKVWDFSDFFLYFLSILLSLFCNSCPGFIAWLCR